MAAWSLPGTPRSRSPARAEARPACGVAGRCRAAGRAAHARSARRTAPGPALPGARPVARPDSRPGGVRSDGRRRRPRRTPRRRRSQTIAAAEGLARSTRTRSMRSGAFWGRRIRRSRAVAIVEGGRARTVWIRTSLTVQLKDILDTQRNDIPDTSFDPRRRRGTMSPRSGRCSLRRPRRIEPHLTSHPPSVSQSSSTYSYFKALLMKTLRRCHLMKPFLSIRATSQNGLKVCWTKGC